MTNVIPFPLAAHPRVWSPMDSDGRCNLCGADGELFRCEGDEEWLCEKCFTGLHYPKDATT